MLGYKIQDVARMIDSISIAIDYMHDYKEDNVAVDLNAAADLLEGLIATGHVQ